ncbi:efflux RND transporter periplasmic adaptor subunit [Sulfurimonas sp.]|uniref:HlyD family secretion protein n=1 Tax=Sulfurimonas sp. TaxID=2022749 RepID=UPI00261503BE|nr:efflux RND transporter periplasmic adaptor subunit [Sulfurimonas sp.]
MSQTKHSSQNSNKRNNILFLLIFLFIASGVAYAFYYYLYAQYYESTDDAYVSQNIIYVTPQTSGVVKQIFVHKTQYVTKGQLLGRLDTRDANLSFEQAKSTLAQTVRKIKALHIQAKEAQFNVALATLKMQKAEADFKRNQVLEKHHAIAINRFEHLEYAYKEARQNLHIMRQKVKAIQAVIRDVNITKNPQVQNAIVSLKRTYLTLKRCNIYAPHSGIVTKKNFSIGENVSLQSTLLAIIPTDGFWVDANFKETQLRHIKVNQNVKLYSDLYGKDVVYHGKVVGISAGTGAVFSLLPPQNATGNWIKIVQRIPIRIALNAKELQKYPLHVGNSMVATVDIHQQDRDALSQMKITQNKNFSAILYKNAMQEATNMAQKIIRKNI